MIELCSHNLMYDTRNCNFFNLLYSYNFSPLVNVAKEETKTSSTCIDHIWCHKYIVSQAVSIIVDVSDYCPIFSKISTLNNEKIIKKTFHTDSNIEDLCNKLGNACDEYFVECDRSDGNLKCEWLLNKLIFIFSKLLIEMQNYICKNLQKPWINAELKHMANYKRSLLKEYKSGKINFDVYNSYKNNLCHKIKNAKKAYFCKKFENCKNDSRKIWKTLNVFYFQFYIRRAIFIGTGPKMSDVIVTW